MAQAKFIPIAKSTTGLNNYLDPVRISYDLKTGETELSQAVNVNIDSSGRPSRRLGRVQKSALSARCGFSFGELCLFVSGSTLYRMFPNYSVTGLRTDLTVGARMRYLPVADRVYYSNGIQKGYIVGGVTRTWVKGTYSGDPQRVYSDPPNGHLLGWFAGRLLVAKDNAIFASEPSFYGVYDLHRGFRPTPDRVTMLWGTPQGLWIGTSSRVEFHRGSAWGQIHREPKAGYGVLEGSMAPCPGEKLGLEGEHVLVTTPEGICALTESGGLINFTHRKLVFPSGKFASAVVAGDRYIVMIEA